MPFPFTSMGLEQSTLADIQAERQRIADAQATATPQLVSGISGLRKAYPWLSPGVNYALASQGYTASHAVAQAAAQTELARQMRLNTGLKLGDVVHVPTGQPNPTINTGYGQVTPAGLAAVGQEQFQQNPDLGKQASKLHSIIQDLRYLKGQDFETVIGRPNIDALGITKQSQMPKMIQQLQKLRQSLLGGNVNALDTASKITSSVDQGVAAYENLNIAQAAASGTLTGFGKITQAISDVIGGGANLYNTVTDELPHGPGQIADATKAVTRAGAVALETPLQAVTGSLRVGFGKDLFQPWTPSDIEHVGEQTSGGQALKALVKGDPVDLGSGFLPNPNSGVEQAQAQAARQYSPQLYDGHAWTPGRAIAAYVTEPGTPAFNLLSGAVDAAYTFKVDPTIVTMTALGDAREAGKTWEGALAKQSTPGPLEALRSGVGTGITPQEVASQRLDEALRAAGHTEAADRLTWRYNAGLIDSTRPTIAQQPAQTFAATNEHMGKVWDAVADERSPSTIVRGFGRNFPIITLDGTPLAKNLGEADTRAAVLGQVVPHLDPYFPQIPDYTRPGSLGNAVENRLAYNLPKNQFDTQDIHNAFWTLNDYMVTAKVPQGVRTQVLDTLINNWEHDKYSGLKAGMDSIAQSLIAHGADETFAKKLTNLHLRDYSDFSKFAVDEMGHNMPILGGLLDGDGHPLPTVQLLSENLARPVTLPDLTEIRRMTANPTIHWLVNNGAWKEAIKVADGLLTTWRDAHLLRPALTARILLDDQASIAATGGDSIFTNPLSAIAWTVGSDQRGLLFRTLRKFAPGLGQTLEEAQFRGRGVWDALGHPFEGDPIIEQGLGRSSYGEYQQNVRRTLNRWVDVRKGDRFYAESLADELNQLRRDPIASGLLKADDPHEWLFNGEGRPWLEKWAQTTTGKRAGMDAALANDPVLARQLSDRYANEVLERIGVKTQGDPRLVEAVRDGTINGKRFSGFHGQPSSDAVSEIGRMVDNENVGPEVVKGQMSVNWSADKKAAAAETRDRAVNFMFDSLLTEPENFWARSPYMRQQYYDRFERLFPNLTVEDRQAFLNRMEDLNLGTDQQNRFRAMLNKPEVANPIPTDAADILSKQFALDQSRTYLHNLYQKSQIFDALRFIFPFGDAWKKLLTRWTKITLENPQIARRVQTGIVGARGAGIFRTDANGQEVFTYPGTGWITDKLLGVPVPLTGAVKNLNLLSEGLPGLGPMVSLPAAYFLPDKPSTDWIRHTIFPFGEPDVSGGLGNTLINELEPAWFKKMVGVWFDSPDSNRTYGNSVMDIARYLYSSDPKYRYDQSDNPQLVMNQLLHDAKDKAKWLSVLRGGVQFFSPSTPTPEYNVKDKNGNLAVMQLAVGELYDHIYGNRSKGIKALGYDGGIKWFEQTYGDGSLLLTQPESTAKVVNLPTQQAGLDWERENPDLVARYPKTWTFFAPQGGAFSDTAYTAQFNRNQRAKMTPEEYLRAANNRIANVRYYTEKAKYPDPTPDDRAYLAAYKDWLIKHYPGYGDEVPNYNNLPSLIHELVQTSNDPKLMKTDAGKGLDLYLKARQSVIDEAHQNGIVGWDKARAMQDGRDYLKAYGEWVVKQHPDFGQMWDYVWSKEIHATNQPKTTAQSSAPAVSQSSSPWATKAVK